MRGKKLVSLFYIKTGNAGLSPKICSLGTMERITAHGLSTPIAFFLQSVSESGYFAQNECETTTSLSAYIVYIKLSSH